MSSLSSFELLRQQWWQGVRLWYNDQDYLAAMHVWWSMMDDDEPCEDYDVPFLTGITVEEAADGYDNENDTYASGTIKRSDENDQKRRWMAPLLLFLAGCYLDAGDYTRARLLLTRCLLSIVVADDSIIINRALAEYMACAQEDPAIPEPWIISRDTLLWAFASTRCRSSMIQWKDPYQRPGFMSAAVTKSQAVYAEEEQPDWCRDLAAHWTEIRDEYLLLSTSSSEQDGDSDHNSTFKPHTVVHNKAPTHWPAVGAGGHREGAGAHDSSVVSPGGDWRELVLFGSGAQPARAPRTAALVQRYAASAVDLAVQGGGEVIFSVLAPHTRIQPHTAGTNIRLTAHLGLVIPNDKDACRIRIRDTWCQWEPGKMLVFDDSYEHEVRNDSNECRAVLLMRFWHPDLAVPKRREVLAQALQCKEDDSLRRYNPPLPVSSNINHDSRSHSRIKLVQGRGMERTQCAQCWRTGFETIRVVERRGGGGDDYIFVCSCGQAIEV
jgi:aspartyl/asparaginyl beta-hydroxylase (cupin superfamily)